MQTYLDAYVGRLRKEMEVLAMGRCNLDFADAMSALCTKPPFLTVGGEWLPAEDVELHFLRDIHPLVEPSRFEHSPIAVTITAETVRVFRNAELSASILEVARRDIQRARAAYIDLPHGSFPLGDDLQVRAILAVPDANGLRFTAAIGPRGSNKARRFSWSAGTNVVADGLQMQACATEMGSRIAFGISVTKYEMPVEHLLGGRPRKIAKLLREIEAGLVLSVAQLRSVLDSGGGEALVDLPHVALCDPRRATGNRKKTERENSFFRIRRLPHLRGVAIMQESRSDAFIAVDGVHAEPRRLIDVRGFFRMQPYGPRHSLRRLTWVPSHSRWIRDDGRTEMIALPRPLAA